MEDKSLQIRVGLLILLALALLAGFVLVLGDFSVGKGVEFTVTFSSSGDIATGAAVRMAGIRIGKVKELTFLKDPPLNPKTGKAQLIQLRVWIEERARDLLKEDSEIYITARGVLGEKYLGITPGTKAANPADLEKPLTGLDPPQTDLIAARLFDFIEDLSGMLRRDGHLVRRILQKGGDVMEIVDSILRENRGDVKTLIAKAGTAMDKVNSMLEEARPAIGDARGLLGRVRREFEKDGRVGAILDNVKSLTATADREAPAIISKVGRLADKATTLADDGRGLIADVRSLLGREKDRIAKILRSIAAVGDKAEKVMTQVHGVVSRIARGEGSIGALLKDDELYDNVREMLRDLKQHPWKVLWKD